MGECGGGGGGDEGGMGVACASGTRTNIDYLIHVSNKYYYTVQRFGVHTA